MGVARRESAAAEGVAVPQSNPVPLVVCVAEEVPTEGPTEEPTAAATNACARTASSAEPSANCVRVS